MRKKSVTLGRANPLIPGFNSSDVKKKLNKSYANSVVSDGKEVVNENKVD